MDKERGSQFRKWDLHIHSLYSISVDYGENNQNREDKEKLFLETLNSNQIEVVGLTNYFKFTDEDFAFKKYLEKNGITVFLNLEVRLSNVNKEKMFIDYHILFDNTLEEQVIKNLLGELRADTQSTKKSFNMLGDAEIRDEATVSFENLLDVLSKNEALRNRYIKGFLSRGHGSATSEGENAPKTHTLYRQVCINSDLLIHSSCDDSTHCSDSKCSHNNLQIDRYYWLKNAPYKKTLVQTSDAHGFSKIGTKYSWIKADKTFEGLKQIIFEPENRVSLDKNKPRITYDELVIDKIIYNDKEIYFSENLNAIIGGRATGKSTLVNSIVNKFSSDTTGNIFENVNLQVLWRDGSENYTRKIEYIPQEYMYVISGNKEKFNELINGIIQEKRLDDAIVKYESDCRNTNTHIQQLLNEYIQKKQNLSELVQPEIEKKLTLDRIGEIKSILEQMLSEHNFTPEEKSDFNSMNEEIENNQLEINNVEQYKHNLEMIKLNEVGIDFSGFELDEESKIKLTNEINEINEYAKTKMEAKINSIIVLYNQKCLELSKKNTDIKESDIYKRGEAFSKKNTEFLNKKKELEIEKSNLLLIEDFDLKKSNLERELTETKETILEEYSKYQQYRNNLQTTFEIKEVDLEIKIVFEMKKLEDEFSYIDARGRKREDFFSALKTDFENEARKIFENETFTYNNGKTSINLINHFFNTNFFKYDYKVFYQGDEFQQMSPGKKSFVVLKLLLEFSEKKSPVFIDQPEDNLDNRAIYEELTKYIYETKRNRQLFIITHNPNIVVGADSENIIIANQHSSDSQNDNNIKFDYINGSLENTKLRDENENVVLKRQGIREHVFEILEGGREAFEKREQKYNLKNDH